MRKSRKYALDILYSADLTDVSVEEAIDNYRGMSDHDTPDYSLTLVNGVVDNVEVIDGYLTPSLGNDWSVTRMATIDRCLARIAVFEMVYADLPPAVAISEAVSLAKELSTDASASFLTGALGHVATLIPRTEAETVEKTG
jgi:N utilization substance protein B